MIHHVWLGELSDYVSLSSSGVQCWMNYKRLLLVWVVIVGANSLVRLAMVVLPAVIKDSFFLSTTISFGFATVLSWFLIPKLFDDPIGNKSNIAAIRAAVVIVCILWVTVFAVAELFY